jgi:DNA-binding SARP family transcriptional activator/tRNA A-37 threonylcarbamoyl transferase component Bud32
VASVRGGAVVRFAAMQFLILGPLEVSDDGAKLALGGPKQRAVLAHLILRANHVVPADLLIDGLWGEEPPESARNTLQTYVYRLRKVLGEDRLEGRDGGYVLAAADAEVDAERFQALVKQGKAQAASDPAAAAATLSEALSLWRGDALADVTEEPSLRGEAARLEELRLSATEHRVSAEIAMGGHSTVVPELESLTARYPLRERMWANLMLALYRSGRQAEALSTFERARQVLTDELGADPSPELQRLHEQILRGSPELVVPVPAAEAAEPARIRPSRIDLQPGTEVAGYRIERTLGRGGMSVVYLAEHDWLQRKVALKVLAPQLAEDERFRERFVRESRLAASLDHPNVIPIYEAGASGGDLFIAMRYVEGTDLRTLLHEAGALEPARAVDIVRQVAAALDAAHEQGLVHRDVKPGNVLLARQRGSEVGEHVYLSDFGLTKRSASDSGITGTGQFVGTLDYAAPEQFKGGTPDARTDVYSLGCVLFECLTGRPPFRSENDAGLMYAHLQEPPPSVTDENAVLPREVDEVVASAMAKAPEDRQQTPGALAADAGRALGLGVPGADGADGRTPLRRLIPALAVAAALVVGIVATSLFQGEATPEGGAAATSGRLASPSPTVPPNFRTVERPLSGDEPRLLTYIPQGVGQDCRPLDRDQPVQGELAALACQTGEVEVLYELFPTRELMDAALEGNANGVRAPNGECATDRVAVTPYTVGGARAGRVLCYTIEHGPTDFGGQEQEPDESHLEWTDENALIYAHAVRNDLGDLTLYDWWLTSAGPLVPGADGEGVIEKDRPTTAAGPPPRDGSYLVLPRGGCAGFPDDQCAMYIDAGSYQLWFTGDSSAAETGRVLIQKPDSVVFAPRTGYCFQGRESGQFRSTSPAGYTWSSHPGTISFERTSGGRCAGPQKLTDEPWTRVPDDLIAVGVGGDLGVVGADGILRQKFFMPDTRPNEFPDWSPDGSRIAFTGGGETGSDLYVMGSDGADATLLTGGPGDEYQPAWSPDGSRIAFAFDDLGDPDFLSGVAIMNPDGSARRDMVSYQNEHVESPLWSPDGTRIAFTRLSEDGLRSDAFVMAADGSGATEVGGGPTVALAWTPDGRRLLVSREGSLLTVDPDGTHERVVLADPPEGGRLVVDWSPDGRWIVMSTAAGSAPFFDALYLANARSGDVFFLGSGLEPDWRPTVP